MKRGQQNAEARPEAARRRKPCSKIEAKLRQRRNKLDKVEKTFRDSPRNLRKKKEFKKSSRSSSSENEISPRFLTSKQHVDLVNFESRRILPVPRFRKLPQNCVRKIETSSHNKILEDPRKTSKSQSQTFLKKETNEVRRSTTEAQLCKSKNCRKTSQTLIHTEISGNKIQTQSQRNDTLISQPSKIIDLQLIDGNYESSNKKRSRSAPCTPLFKIKCAKERCPRNLFVERKSLVTDKAMPEKIRKCRKNCFRGLRISRSGEVAVTSEKGSLIDDRIIERASLEHFGETDEEIKALLIPKNLQLSQGKDMKISFLSENEKLLEEKDVESSLRSENAKSPQEKDIESSVILSEAKLLQKENAELSSFQKNTKSFEEVEIESSNFQETTKQGQHEDCNLQSLGKEINRSSFISTSKQSLLQKDELLPEDKSRNNTNYETPEIKEEIFKESKNESVSLKNSNSEVLKSESNDRIHEVKQGDGKVIEDNLHVAESPKRREESEKHCSPRKPPKKRAFKWQTILEKQHQSSCRSPENRKNVLENTTEIQEENKFHFWTEKDAHCSKYCRWPRSRMKSFEERKLEAFNAIREELPKMLMKRRCLEAAKNSGKEVGAIKNDKWQHNQRNSIHLASSPERFDESTNRNDSRLDPRFMEHFAKCWERCNYPTLPNNSKQGDARFSQEIFNDSRFRGETKNQRIVEDSPRFGYSTDPAQHLIDKNKNCYNCQVSPKNRAAHDLASSPQTPQELVNCHKVPRTLVQKHRQSPSPRRVTFRLPGRVIDENILEDQEDKNSKRNFSENVKNSEKSIAVDPRNSNNTEHQEKESLERNPQLRSHEKNTENELKESPFAKDKFRSRSRVVNSCIEEKTRRFASSNIVAGAQIARNLQNMRWTSPPCRAMRGERNGNQSEDSEQDWETPTAEDVHRSKDITFPKETRQAMKILIRAKNNVSTCKHFDHCTRRIDRRDVFNQRNDYPRTETSPQGNPMQVSSYAKALAKFQEGCDFDNHQSFCGTLPQRRVSQERNVPGGK